jgi:hypothetical protein
MRSAAFRFPWRAAALLAAAVAGAAVVYLLRPSAPTDDTYAFLDWGRALRHGSAPLLEQRTFQPLPIVAGAVLSLFGSATATATVLASLTALMLLAAAAWRIVAVLGFPQPAPAVAAVLTIANPLLAILGLVAYNNLPYATLLLWALVFALEDRRARTWTLLAITGLWRPEAWAFLGMYGLVTWWRAGHPLSPRRWWWIALLTLGPMALWVGLEWALFGDALYSFHSTTAPHAMSSDPNSPYRLWGRLRATMTPATMDAAAVGAVALAALSSRRSAVTTLGATLLAAITVGVLALSNFNVPGRHFSALVSLLLVLAAVGASAPAAALRRLRPSAGWAVAGLGLAGAALMIGFAWAPAAHTLRRDLKSIGPSHDADRSLARDVSRARPLIDVRGARRHSVGMVGAVENSAVVFDLGVPFNAVTDHVAPHAQLVVEPSVTTYDRLVQLKLTDRARWRPTRGWHLIYRGDWLIFGFGRHTPVQLSARVTGPARNR